MYGRSTETRSGKPKMLSNPGPFKQSVFIFILFFNLWRLLMSTISHIQAPRLKMLLFSFSWKCSCGYIEVLWFPDTHLVFTWGWKCSSTSCGSALINSSGSKGVMILDRKRVWVINHGLALCRAEQISLGLIIENKFMIYLITDKSSLPVRREPLNWIAELHFYLVSLQGPAAWLFKRHHCTIVQTLNVPT